MIAVNTHIKFVGTALLWGFFSFLSPCFLIAQSDTSFNVFGIVKGDDGVVLPGASVYAMENPRFGTSTNSKGEYSLTLPHSGPWTLKCSMVGFTTKKTPIEFVTESQQLHVTISLLSTVKIGEAEVLSHGEKNTTIKRIDPKVANKIPTPRGTIEDVLLQAPVNFTSELSSSYNVRGGSFDENLVYVNDIEVYRPFLTRSGQQEGLSFPNPDMVDRINFSAGGFESKYGDKMSSVLDIHYRKPQKNATSVIASLMGAQVQHDGLNKKGNIKINSGFRYRNNSYILGTLDETGEYSPTYLDAQSYVTWDPDGYGPWEVQFLGVFGENEYQFIPQDRQTDVGTINNAIRLNIFYDGKEQTSYQTGFGAIALERATENSRIRWINSAYLTVERETFDIIGAYRLDELELDPGSDDFGESAGNLGVGAFFEHARNQLEATVLSTALKGSYNFENQGHFLEYGVKFQSEYINDNLEEWAFIDSAGFLTPHPQDSIGIAGNVQPIIIEDLLMTQNSVRSNRMTGYLQDTWTIKTGHGEINTHVGMRGHLWSLKANDHDIRQHIVGGPRAHLSYISDNKPKTIWNLSSGYYWQPPFYREMRNHLGEVNPDILPQRAIHFVGGVNHEFEMFTRPFKFVGEAYYKDLDQLIPYEVENVRQRYFGLNNSSGYATGIDLMLNGEFIEGIQSWMRVSALTAREDLIDDMYVNYYNSDSTLIIPGYTWNDNPAYADTIFPGFIPRPSDQRLSVSLLFQDEMPSNPDYKVLLSLFFGTGLPYGPPTLNRYEDVLRTAAYRRVDIGFSKDFNKGYFALEVFNILGINNTISHTWLEDVNGRMYAIPNFLTGRRLNLKLHLNF
ncbi:MAG: hypothetical protein CMB32_06205 [Euryarchaeota archaeon]|nr:hypothetical protein [Euryarchaeota archaeon]